jgi:hypothetical protein
VTLDGHCFGYCRITRLHRLFRTTPDDFGAAVIGLILIVLYGGIAIVLPVTEGHR